MNADILKRLVRAIADGSQDDLTRLVHKVVESERQTRHTKLAEQLEAIPKKPRLVKNSKSQPVESDRGLKELPLSRRYGMPSPGKWGSGSGLSSGVAQRSSKRSGDNRPTQTGSVVRYIGEAFHMNYLPAEQLLLAEVGADYWKTWGQERLKTPVPSPGAMHLFQGSGQEHLSLAKHLTSERKVEEFVAGKGTVVRW